MIGDPKQAIYSFRGGDIFTYMKAKHEAGVQHYSLQTNWRSEAALIQAVNSLFKRQKAAFIYAGSIDFDPVLPAPKEDEQPLLVDGSMASPLTIWKIPLDQNQKPLSKERAYEKLHLAVANEIAHLIRGGEEGQVKLGENPLRSADIAVLVRTGYEGYPQFSVSLQDTRIDRSTRICQSASAFAKAREPYAGLPGSAQLAARSAARRQW